MQELHKIWINEVAANIENHVLKIVVTFDFPWIRRQDLYHWKEERKSITSLEKKLDLNEPLCIYKGLTTLVYPFVKWCSNLHQMQCIWGSSFFRKKFHLIKHVTFLQWKNKSIENIMENPYYNYFTNILWFWKLLKIFKHWKDAKQPCEMLLGCKLFLNNYNH